MWYLYENIVVVVKYDEVAIEHLSEQFCKKIIIMKKKMIVLRCNSCDHNDCFVVTIVITM